MQHLRNDSNRYITIGSGAFITYSKAMQCADNINGQRLRIKNERAEFEFQ